MNRYLLLFFILFIVVCKKSETKEDHITGSFTCYFGNGDPANFTFTDNSVKTENIDTTRDNKVTYPKPNYIEIENYGTYFIDKTPDKKTFTLRANAEQSSPEDISCETLLSKQEFEKLVKELEKSRAEAGIQ
jgi:hypothetical protein